MLDLHEIPPVGTRLYLSQRTGNPWVDMVKKPYTVVRIINDKKIVIQEAKCEFPTPRYYDSLPINIKEDEDGDILELNWAPKKHKWQYKSFPSDSYPYYAYFGRWEYQPYLD